MRGSSVRKNERPSDAYGASISGFSNLNSHCSVGRNNEPRVWTYAEPLQSCFHAGGLLWRRRRSRCNEGKLSWCRHRHRRVCLSPIAWGVISLLYKILAHSERVLWTLYSAAVIRKITLSRRHEFHARPRFYILGSRSHIEFALGN